MIAETGRRFARMFRLALSGPSPKTALTSSAPQRAAPVWTSPLLFAALALVIRLPMFGLPAFQSDEQFYLLVGQRMQDGAIPFVDIWDRKPIGLFLIYRAVHAFPLDPVLGYQLLGLGTSVATALVIERIARLIAPRSGARLAGVAYLLYQAVFNVALGQSPVFYNLPVALAGYLTVQATLTPEDRTLPCRGVTIMALLGLAMQIKYTAVFEGCAMGLLLLARARRDGRSLAHLSGLTLLWVATALAPTALALLVFVQAGHGEAFIQANFLSIFSRETDQFNALRNLFKEALAMMPFTFAVFHAPAAREPGSATRRAALAPLRIWVLAAVFGFLVVGTWYDHYLGPVLVPLSILAAPALAHATRPLCWYRRLVLGVGAVGAVAVPAFQIHEKGSAREFASASNEIARELHGRCLYVYEGDSALYRTTHACIPTRFAYPSHLNARNEARALGIDPAAEVARILHSRPGVVVLREDARQNQPNRASAKVIEARLPRTYQRYRVITLGTRRYALYRLRQTAP